jgi:hypothetical protein
MEKLTFGPQVLSVGELYEPAKVFPVPRGLGDHRGNPRIREAMGLEKGGDFQRFESFFTTM